MAEPKVASRSPYVLDVKPGAYAWCACGQSRKQPYCDGSHAGSGFTPVIAQIDAAKKVAWCGCKHTGSKPFCDGSHARLPS